MKVLIIGPGALGCLLAAKLSRNNEVWVLDHDLARAAWLAAAGLVLAEGGQETRHFLRVTAEPEQVGLVDLALLCVKSRMVEGAVASAWPALREAALLVALQNGIGHLDVLPRLCRSICWALGATNQGATLVGPGQVQHRGSGPTWIGLPPRQFGGEPAGRPSCRQSLLLAAETLSEVGIPTEAVADILPRLWNKLLVNVGINALTAINNCPNGALLDDPESAELMAAAIAEGALVAKKLGIKLDRDPLAAARAVCGATATNLSSMLQDLRAGRPTEIEAINGAVLRLAGPLGLPLPVNEALVRKVRELERNQGRK
jgi:2-dehydropantoate 2-reductase